MPLDAIEETYDEHADALFGFLLNLTRHEADTRDLLQAVFVKMAKNPSMLSNVASKRAYLFQVAYRQFVDLVRHRAAGERTLTRVAALQPTSAILLPDPATCTDERRLIEDALHTLPKEQRAVVHLHLWEELTFEQIANVTGVSKATAASRYRYALDKLRLKLADMNPSTI